MFAVGVYVCEYVHAYCRACVNFVLNVTLYSNHKIMHYHTRLFHLEKDMDH